MIETLKKPKPVVHVTENRKKSLCRNTSFTSIHDFRSSSGFVPKTHSLHSVSSAGRTTCKKCEEHY